MKILSFLLTLLITSTGYSQVLSWTKTLVPPAGCNEIDYIHPISLTTVSSAVSIDWYPSDGGPDKTQVIWFGAKGGITFSETLDTQLISNGSVTPWGLSTTRLVVRIEKYNDEPCIFRTYTLKGKTVTSVNIQTALMIGKDEGGADDRTGFFVLDKNPANEWVLKRYTF